MIESVQYLHTLILNHSFFQYVIVFFGAAFGGELALFAIAFLTAQGVLSLFSLVTLSFLGTFSSDILWFLLGRTVMIKKIISSRYANGAISILVQAVDRVSRGNRFLALIIAKFLVGTRILLIMYVSKTDLGLRRFIHYDAIAVLLWLAVIIPIGFVSGLGFTYLAEIFNNLYIEIGLILFILFIVVIIRIWFERIFTKKVDIKI